MSIPKPLFLRESMENLKRGGIIFQAICDFERVIPRIFALACDVLPGFKKEFHLMNTDTVQGKWKQMKGAVKQRWAKLTDDDLTALSGKKDELVGKLQERYGYTREQAVKEADDWAAKSSHQWDDDARSAGAGTR
jgi:uncharacterized protein YjbJ (UPF0337 family)